MTRSDEITEAMLEDFKLEDIEDTIENRHAFLTGLRDGWKEDTSESVEKSLYLMTIGFMIANLKMQIHRKNRK